jgi:hypothetical protein
MKKKKHKKEKILTELDFVKRVRLYWTCDPVTRVIKSKTVYSRKVKHKIIDE